MTLNRTEIMKRDELLRRAVAEGKVVQNSTLYQTLSDVFSIRPQVAEEMVAQLTPTPLAAASNGVVRIGVATTPPAGDGYESGWLTGRERERIANAQAGYESVSHTFE